MAKLNLEKLLAMEDGIYTLAYIANEIDDGFYFINLQIPAFINDAVPSRPVLYAAQSLQ